MEDNWLNNAAVHGVKCRVRVADGFGESQAPKVRAADTDVV